MTRTRAVVWQGAHGPCAAHTIVERAPDGVLEAVLVTEHSNGHPEGRGRNAIGTTREREARATERWCRGPRLRGEEAERALDALDEEIECARRRY